MDYDVSILRGSQSAQMSDLFGQLSAEQGAEGFIARENISDACAVETAETACERDNPGDFAQYEDSAISVVVRCEVVPNAK